jgi:energy-coupling factor transport system ATP-binding protein
MNRARDVTLIVSGLTDKEIGNYAGRVIEVAKGAIVFDGPAKDYLQGRDDSSSSAPRVNPRECSVTVCRIQSLEFTHADSNFKLHTPDRDIRAGSVTAITGRNGSGKTTLLKLLASILRPSNGSVNSSGNAFYLSADPTNTLVCDTVKAEIELGFLETGFQRNENLVSKIIEILRLDRLLNLHPRDLSFFQRYSVALASLAVLRPTMLLLDEPSRGAGEIGESALIELFNQLSSDCGTAVVIASNDRSFINGCTDEVIQLQ